MAGEQFPQNVEDDGCFSSAGATCDDKVFGLPTDDGFGLAFLDEKRLAVRTKGVTDVGDFLRTRFDFFVSRRLSVDEERLGGFFNDAFGVEMLGKV